MSAQTSVSCPADRRFRSLMTFCRSDVIHAARALSRHPDSPLAVAAAEEARRIKEMIKIVESTQQQTFRLAGLRAPGDT